MLAERRLALLLQLLDVTDQSGIGIDFELFILLHLFLLLLLSVDLLIDEFVYFCNISGSFITKPLALVKIISEPGCNFDGTRV